MQVQAPLEGVDVQDRPWVVVLFDTTGSYVTWRERSVAMLTALKASTTKRLWVVFYNDWCSNRASCGCCAVCRHVYRGMEFTGSDADKAAIDVIYSTAASGADAPEAIGVALTRLAADVALASISSLFLFMDNAPHGYVGRGEDSYPEEQALTRQAIEALVDAKVPVVPVMPRRRVSQGSGGVGATAHLGFAYALAWVTGGYVLALPDDASPLQGQALDVASVREGVEALDTTRLPIGAVLWDVPAERLKDYVQEGGAWSYESQALPRVYECLPQQGGRVGVRVTDLTGQASLVSVDTRVPVLGLHSVEDSKRHKYNHRPSHIHRQRP
jgi:hypothetical protein